MRVLLCNSVRVKSKLSNSGDQIFARDLLKKISCFHDDLIFYQSKPEKLYMQPKPPFSLIMYNDRYSAQICLVLRCGNPQTPKMDGCRWRVIDQKCLYNCTQYGPIWFFSAQEPWGATTAVMESAASQAASGTSLERQSVQEEPRDVWKKNGEMKADPELNEKNP